MTLEEVDRSAFERAADTILSARTIYIVGIRSCAPLASFLAFYLHMIFPDVRQVQTNSSSEIFEQMIRITEDDVVIGISFPRYSMRTMKALEFANSRKAKVITITDSVHSPMNVYAACTLIAKSDMASIVDSLVAPLSVINALVVALCMKRQADVKKTLESMEKLWDEYQVYSNDEINGLDDARPWAEKGSSAGKGESMRKAAVIGGGAAGMMTAVLAAGEKTEIHLYEKNEKLGKKLFITGKGRCNVTNDCPTEEFFTNVVTNPKFLYSSAYSFDSAQVQEFFEAAGVRLKVERGNRVFPESDHSSDIIRALETELKRKNVQVHKNTKVKELLFEGDRVKGIRLENGKELFYDDVVVATGGMSYQTTGSDGDGYRFAEEAGLAVTPLRPALVPLETEEAYIRELQGLSLKNVTMTIKNGKKTLFDGFGEMLFTHFGISGPLGLSASSYIGKALEQQPLKGYLNLKPALTEEQLDARILREFEENRNKQFRNVINSLFPAKLLPVMLSLGGIDPYKQVNAVSKAERQHFEELITHFPFTVTGTRGFREAIITQGGVSVKEIRPGTMEAKKKEGLYFVGEVLDLDALTGGFNLQIAWASAHAAAEEIRAKEEQE